MVMFDLGLVKEGRMYFDSMKRSHKIEPKIEHYGCFVDLLGLEGLLYEAEELIDKIPNVSDEVFLPLRSVLLGACRIHHNVQMGEHVAKCVIGKKSSSFGIHSLAANLYAAVDRWDDVAGLNKVKQSLLEMVMLPTKRKDLFIGLCRPTRGLLLFGSPGNEKNHACRNGCI